MFEDAWKKLDDIAPRLEPALVREATSAQVNINKLVSEGVDKWQRGSQWGDKLRLEGPCHEER